jgi:hypothetical protein
MRFPTVAFLLFVLASPLRATVLIGTDLGELSHEAVAIARGTVVATAARWTANRRTIETVVTLRVERCLKGSLGETVDFRVPGGELGRFRNLVVGAPAFAVDERVVVFLGARAPSVPFVLGLSQGVFRVGLSADRWVVTSPTFDPSSTAAAAIVRGDVRRVAVDLAEFEQRVAGLVGGAR